MRKVAAKAAFTFVCIKPPRFRCCASMAALRAMPKSQLREGCQNLWPRPAPIQCALVGPHGAQHEMVGARWTNDLQAHRQACPGEAGWHRGGRRTGQVEG